MSTGSNILPYFVSCFLIIFVLQFGFDLYLERIKKLLDPSTWTDFSAKLVFGITGLSFLGLVAVYIIINTVVYNIIYDSVIGNAKRDVTFQAREIDAWFERHSQLIENIAITWMTVGVEPGENGFGPDPIGARLLENDDSLVGIFVGFENGWHVNSSGWIPPEGFHAPDRPWYIIPEAAGGEVAITLPYVRLLDGDIVTSMGIWLPEMMGMEAVVGMDISLAYVFDKIASYEFVGGGYLAMVGPDGEIIVHPNPAYMLAPDREMANIRDIPNGYFLMNSIMAGVGLSEFYDYRFGESYIIAIPLTAIDWTLIAVFPVEAVQGPLFQNMRTIMTALALFIITLLTITLIFFSRISKREKAEIEMKNAEMRRRETVENESMEKSKFLARMSHEIRTPLNAVLGIAEIQLKAEGLSPKTEEAFCRIHRSSTMLLAIINDILDLSKVEAGKMEIIPSSYELAGLLADIMQQNVLRIGNRQIEFKLNLKESLPYHLIGDELRIKQILNNILSNAFKYTDEGQITLSVDTEDASGGSQITLVLRVEDTGKGMTTEQIGALFDNFEHYNLQNKRFSEGAGFGMTIACQLAAMMGGNIKVESEPEKGSTFIVRLPQKLSDEAVIDKETRDNLQSLKVAQTLLKGISKSVHISMPYARVLVVDDVESNLFVAEGILMQYKIAAETARNGQEAIEKVKSGKVYDIIFMDHMMPEMDGIETTRIIRAMGYIHPIVALTANALKGAAEMFLDNGFSGFISKPIDLQQLELYLLHFINDEKPSKTIKTAVNRHSDTTMTSTH